MAFVVSSRRSQELATTAVTPIGREAVEGLPNPKPIVDFLPASLQEDDFWSAPLWKRSVIAARTRPLLDEWRRWIRDELAASQ